jgi:DNA-binding XRE family transcriptional regulator
MINSKTFDVNLFEKIFDLNSKNKIGANTIAVFTFILYKCEDLRKEIVLSDYQMARELGLSRQTIITAKNKLKLLGLLDYNRNRGFPNRFILKGNEMPKATPKIGEIKENQIVELDQILEPEIIVNNSFSKYPSLKQFMDFAKSLKDYSELLDNLLIQKFHKWEEADWKNSVGRPILNWQSTLEKNMNTLEFSHSYKSSSLSDLPIIKRPKLD